LATDEPPHEERPDKLADQHVEVGVGRELASLLRGSQPAGESEPALSAELVGQRGQRLATFGPIDGRGQDRSRRSFAQNSIQSAAVRHDIADHVVGERQLRRTHHRLQSREVQLVAVRELSIDGCLGHP